MWNNGEGREKRKKLVWKLAVFKAFGVKGGVRCYRMVALPFADIWERENAGIQEDWFSWETHIPLCNVGLRKWHMKGISCCLIYTNCASGTQWSGVSRLYLNIIRWFAIHGELEVLNIFKINTLEFVIFTRAQWNQAQTWEMSLVCLLIPSSRPLGVRTSDKLTQCWSSTAVNTEGSF